MLQIITVGQRLYKRKSCRVLENPAGGGVRGLKLVAAAKAAFMP
jgi:hypothetical protein